MGEDLAPANMHQPLTETNSTQNSRPKSRELLSSLFGQVAATVVRNLIDDGVATLEKLDKMLVERVAQFTERRKQLKTMRNEDERQHVLQLLDKQHDSSLDHDYKEDDTSYELYNEELKHLKDD